MDSNISIKSTQANHAYTKSISIERERGYTKHIHKVISSSCIDHVFESYSWAGP